MRKTTASVALVFSLGLGVALGQQENETKRQDPMPNPKTTMDDKRRDADDKASATGHDKKDADRDSSALRKKHKRHKKLRHKAVKKDVATEAPEPEPNHG